MKTYRASPAAARNYVEADRGRADDYYLAEGAGVAERYVASPGALPRRLAPLTGDGYEAWVAGVDPVTGVAKGRLRGDDRAVRFVEVVVNGPKSWSLAAELHPDVSAAYDVAQDRAATQIIGWLAEHATTRVGPRGGQVQVPVSEIEAVTVRHRTSRAGDPHRHLHLQVNARVFADGQSRGLHTVGVRDSLDAVNGIGHAAVMTDPGFRAALAAHGLTLDSAGEVTQLAPYVGAFSARAGQIGRNLDRYETEWRAAHPDQTPGPGLHRAWDARAWADGRPDKIAPAPGADLTSRWVDTLHSLGYRDAVDLVNPAVDLVNPVADLVSPAAVPVGSLNRDAAVREVLVRLAARRSGWNAADVRGEVEQLLARKGVVVDASVRLELAEDLTARTLARCVPLLERGGVPEHVRALTSEHVLEVEADLIGRLGARGTPTPVFAAKSTTVTLEAASRKLDQAQLTVAGVLAGRHQLVLLEGAAGSGKTTTLSAARDLLTAQGRRLVVVTPTLKAARVAEAELGSRAGSAAWLAFQHGYRWDDDGRWTRLQPGQPDPDTGRLFLGPRPAAALREGDLLLVDEAGMLDQDTARALLTIADEHDVRVALVGDRRQLCAVGRGGVLDLAARWVHPSAHVTLESVHRFVCTVTAEHGAETVPDLEYAQLSLAMRVGENPDLVFEALLGRGQVRVHASDTDRLATVADTGAANLVTGGHTVLVADTRELVGQLNAAVRDQLVAAGRVDDQHATVSRTGERIGVGDRVVTRRNNTSLNVANRDTWTVTAVDLDGGVTVVGEHGNRQLPASYVRRNLELGYASTVHGVQGETAAVSHLILGEHTGAASAYVGMTRGREANIAHLVADSIDEAREQWVAAFTRDRADLGAAHAARLAEQEAAHYAEHRPLAWALADLRKAWTREHFFLDRLAAAEQRRDRLTTAVALTTERDTTVPGLRHDYDDARQAAHEAQSHLRRQEAVVSAHAEDLAGVLAREWDQQREPARHAARTVRHGTGWFGRGRGAVGDAAEQLQQWAGRWQPYLPDMPTTVADISGRAAQFDYTPHIHDALRRHARHVAEQAHPDYAAARVDADTTVRQRDRAWRTLHDTQAGLTLQLADLGRLAHHPHPAQLLADAEHTLTAAQTDHDTAHHRVASLLDEPALRSLPADRITAEREQWSADRDHAAELQRALTAQRDADSAPRRHHHRDAGHRAAPQHDRGISR